MTSTELLAILAALLFLVTAVAITLRDGASTPQLWLLPATLSATLLGFSLVTVASEGPVALWEAHSKDCLLYTSPSPRD